MSVDAFVASANSSQRVLQALNAELFGGKLDLELVVYAPESGSVRQVLRVVVHGGIGAYAVIWSVIQLLETDIAKGVVKELTGKLPAEIAVEAAKEYKESVVETGQTRENKADQELKKEDEAAAQIAAVLSQASSCVLASSRGNLDDLKVSERTRFELADAQAQMFEKCLADRAVSAIEFEDTDFPPVPRSQFPQRAIRPRKPSDDSEEGDKWIVSIESYLVTSPNLEESDQYSRKWKGKSAADKTKLFIIEDQEFWSKLRRKELRFSEDTELEVQVASRFIDGKIKETKVLRVLKFEGEEIGQPIDENGLRAILGELNSDEKDEGFGSLLL